jgi:choline dehydrogenase
MELEFDFIIIGAGTAGCLLANRLSADPTARVLLVEAGGPDNYPWIHIPVGYLYCIGNPRTDWLYKTASVAGLAGRQLLYPRGKTLGGCSSINGMIYMRGQARDYDRWAEITGDDAWSWANVLPDFKAHEDHARLDHHADEHSRAFHGHGGEWRVERQRSHWDILDAFATAAHESGIPYSDDFNRGDNDGIGYFEVNQRRGFRWNTARAFLNKIRHRPNLTIWTKTRADRLRFEAGVDGRPHCTGVDLRQAGTKISVTARREVILSAGAVASPQLLMLSGIGRADDLHALNIPVVLNAAGVGRNLQDHLQLRAVYRLTGAKTLNTMMTSLWGKAKIGLEYALFQTGPMSMSPSQLGIFTRSDPHQPYPNIQYHVQPLSLDAFGQPLHDFPALTASVCNLNPASRGTIGLNSPDPDIQPIIQPNYLDHPDDHKVAADSLRVTRNILNQPALADYHPQEFKPGSQFQTDDELAAAAGQIGTTIFHPTGTTAMGPASNPLSVVDSHLRVHGMTGLRVVDAGVMPQITSGNTNSPTLMIAEKAAAWIKAGQ